MWNLGFIIIIYFISTVALMLVILKLNAFILGAIKTQNIALFALKNKIVILFIKSNLVNIHQESIFQYYTFLLGVFLLSIIIVSSLVVVTQPVSIKVILEKIDSNIADINNTRELQAALNSDIFRQQSVDYINKTFELFSQSSHDVILHRNTILLEAEKPINAYLDKLVGINWEQLSITLLDHQLLVLDRQNIEYLISLLT